MNMDVHSLACLRLEFAKRLVSASSISKALVQRYTTHLRQNYTSVYSFGYEGLSKNFSFWIVSLDLDAMFKIKSLLYKDLILNSLGMSRK